ncbi:MAG: hypothetical protein U0166_09480 [Acidobacteriota bacterium]
MRHLTRANLIYRLRDYLKKLVDDEHSLCLVAARKGIFCKGFAQWSDDELRKKFAWIADARPGISREELEDVINRYKLGRTEALGCDLPCDAQMIDRDTCFGWDGFSDEDLVRFHKEWYGEEVKVTAVA